MDKTGAAIIVRVEFFPSKGKRKKNVGRHDQ